MRFFTLEMSLILAHAHTWLEDPEVKADVGEAADAEVATVVRGGSGGSGGCGGNAITAPISSDND